MRSALTAALLLVSTPALPYSLPPRELQCIADAVYVEARGELFEGQLAVAHVILNRVADPHFPKTPCAVVRQPHAFPWHRPVRVTDRAAYDWALTVARIASEDRDSDPTAGALCFDRRTAPPPCRGYHRTRVIGGHSFYGR